LPPDQKVSTEAENGT
jgi:hypothetical protein